MQNFLQKMLCRLASARSYLKLWKKCQNMKKITLFIMDVGVMDQSKGQLPARSIFRWLAFSPFRLEQYLHLPSTYIFINIKISIKRCKNVEFFTKNALYYRLASARSYLKQWKKCQNMKKITLFIMDVGVLDQRFSLSGYWQGKSLVSRVGQHVPQLCGE